MPIASGVLPEWFFQDPPPLANRGTPSTEWLRRFRQVESDPASFGQFRPTDLFKAWNSVYARSPCTNDQLRHAPDYLFLFDPAEDDRYPTYRFLPNATTPLGLVTNQIGWRGPPVGSPRGAKTIRVVFVGASTTVGLHHIPFSYPEFIGPWLNLWAASKQLDIHFETLNAGRESIDSNDIAAIVRNEVLPLRPDLVVYYEGANQFDLASVVPNVPKTKASRPVSSAETAPAWLRTASRYSELGRRLMAVSGYAATDIDGREWPKPDYNLVWPEGLDESNPDLSFPHLPVQLNTIERNLDRIRADLNSIGADFALSSFFRLASDGLELNPIRHRFILEDLNVSQFPFRYRDIERLTVFENRVFAKYARTHDLAFLDIARTMPRNPDLMIDSIHTTGGGTRVQAWAALQQLIPVVERRLAEHRWPSASTGTSTLPTYNPRHVPVSCKSP